MLNRIVQKHFSPDYLNILIIQSNIKIVFKIEGDGFSKFDFGSSTHSPLMRTTVSHFLN